MQTLLPYLCEFLRIIEVGWDNDAKGLNGRQEALSLGELQAAKTGLPRDGNLENLRSTA